MPTQNRKQQRLARNLAKSEGISYQTALIRVRTPPQAGDALRAASESHPPLFDLVERTNANPAGHSEGSFAFLNRAAGPFWDNIRTELEQWYTAFPDEDGDLRSRFRKSAASQHYAAWWELYLHHLFTCLGFKIEVHPTLEHASGRPDFVLTRRRDIFYMEAMTIFSGIQEEGRHGAREAEVQEALDAVSNGNFHLQLSFDAVGSSSPRRAPITRKVARWLDSLDPDVVIAGHGNKQDLPHMRITEGDWRLELTALPRSPGKRGDPGHPLLMGPPSKGIVNDVSKLRAALERKRQNYGRPGTPLVLAVLSMSAFMNNRDVANALFGREAIPVSSLTIGESKMTRQPDGFWLDRSGAANTHVSAVLLAKNILHHNCAGTWPRLWHHPTASHTLDIDLPFSVAQVIDGDLRLTDSPLFPYEVLGLKADWPGPDLPFPE